MDEIERLSLKWEDLGVHTDVAAFGLFEKNATTINGHLQHHFTFQKKFDILEFISFERYFNKV